MDIGIGVLKLLFGFIKYLGKPILKLLIFTGLIIPIILLIVDVNLKLKLPALAYYLTFIIAAVILIQNIIRMFKGDKSFSFLKLFIGGSQSLKEKGAINPKVDKEHLQVEEQGFIFGKKNKKYVAKGENEDGHILVIGGAGSGKSSCLAIPSLKSWKERVFSIDIKGELSEKTKGYRVDSKIFNPNDRESAGYDPYYLLDTSTNLVQDVKEIALAIMPIPKEVKDPFWVKSAQNIFIASMLYFYEQKYSFIRTIEKIQSTPIEQLINEIKEGNNQDAKYFINSFIGLDIKTLSGIYTELSNNIMLFATDQQIKETLTRDYVITPEDLENGIDIYVVIEESKLEQWKGLLTLIVNQFLKHFERRANEGATPILFLLDEFARLGKIETMSNGLATLRSKKITIALLIQSLAQLDEIYGQETRKVIADNCSYKAILKATDADTQEYFSKLVGTYDKAKKSHNSNYEQYTGLGKGTGTSTTTEEKRIIKPEEFAYLKDIVLLTPMGFYRVDKAPYYLN